MTLRPCCVARKRGCGDAGVRLRSLPERIRPAVCAFGGLADGFLPFDVGGGRTERLTLASVVMKAVQVRPMQSEVRVQVTYNILGLRSQVILSLRLAFCLASFCLARQSYKMVSRVVGSGVAVIPGAAAVPTVP